MRPIATAKPLIPQRGLSLVELMVAMAVGLLLLGGVIQVYLSSKQGYNAQNQLSRMQESGRFAMDLITRDLRRAGYWGGNADTTVTAGHPGPAPAAHSCTTGSNAWGRMTEWRVSGRNGTNDGYPCAAGYSADTDILTIRYAGPEILPDAQVTGDRLYLRSTLFLAWLMTGTEKNHGNNQPPSEVTNGPAHLDAVARPIVSNAYYIGDSGRTCPGGQRIPALFRVELNGSGHPAAREIASGVEQLQVRYLLNDSYVDADAVVGDDWLDVMAVRVWLLVRGECPEPGFLNENTYTMGDTTVPAAPDNFRRQLYVSTVMLRNNLVR